MPSPSYLTLSFRDFGGHLLGSKPQLTGLAGATSPLLNPYLMAELVSSVLTHLARPSLLAEDVKGFLSPGVSLQTHPEDLDDPAWSEVMGYHQTAHGFSFFGTKLAQRGLPDRFAVLYCQPDGSWRAHGLDFPLPSDASQAVVQIFQALESAFPAPVREPPAPESAPTPAPEATTLPAARLFTPLTETAFVAYMLKHFEGTDAGDDEDELDWVDLDDIMERGLSRTGLPVTADHSPYISFDTENILAGGIEEFSDGLTMWRGEAGGDWQWPVTFFVYVDGDGELCTYVPLQGNAYDRETNEAYDNEVLVNGQLPLELQADFSDMSLEICQAFGLSAKATESTEAVNPKDLAQRLRSILEKAAAEHISRPTPTDPPSPLAQTPALPSKRTGKISTEDCKALLDQHPAVTAMGLAGPWKRVSKKGNAQSGVVRVFEGAAGWAKLLEKNGQLTLVSLSLEPLS